MEMKGKGRWGDEMGLFWGICYSAGVGMCLCRVGRSWLGAARVPGAGGWAADVAVPAGSTGCS